MTVSDAEAATYCRQAAALWTHHARGDSEGFAVVMGEVRTSQDAAHVVLALLNIVESILPPILTPLAREQVDRMVVSFAGHEHRP